MCRIFVSLHALEPYRFVLTRFYTLQLFYRTLSLSLLS